MAAFTVVSAEARVKVKGPYGDRTWVNAFSATNQAGTIVVRVQRYMTPTNPDYGGWVQLTDDGAT